MGQILLWQLFVVLLVLNTNDIRGFLSPIQIRKLSCTTVQIPRLYSHGNRDVVYQKKLIEYDEWNNAKEFLWDDSKQQLLSSHPNQAKHKTLSTFLNDCFIPSGDLTIHYYRYMFWRAIQRFVNATNNVFGTQALLLALGLKKNRIGTAAAITWVLKDALGKLSRIVWASSYGRKFDLDAKKWRFRSGIINAVGNGLEVLTYLFPSLFLIMAALANALKQMSMLTSSSTRNTIYKAFSKHLDNIGDITAKGEAQTAVIDLFGMFLGIFVSKSINASKWKIVAIIIFLSLFELFCVYHEIRSVVYHNLNYERTKIVLQKVFRLFAKTSGQQQHQEQVTGGETTTFHDFVATVKVQNESALNASIWSQFVVAMEKSFFVPKEHTNMSLDELYEQLTPEYVANVEDLVSSVIPGQHILTTWSTLQAPPGTIHQLLVPNYNHTKPTLSLSSGNSSKRQEEEKFAVLIDSRPSTSFFEQLITNSRLFSQQLIIPNHNHQYLITPQILLHKNGQGKDLFRAFIVLHRVLFLLQQQSNDLRDQPFDVYLEQCLVNAKIFEQQHGDDIIALLEKSGWDMHRFAYGSMRIRVEW